MIQDDADDAFVADLERLFGARARSDPDFAERLCDSICQATWTHAEKGESGFTYRGAEWVMDDLVGMPNKGDFYIRPSAGTIDPEIAEALHTAGWQRQVTPVAQSTPVTPKKRWKYWPFW